MVNFLFVEFGKSNGFIHISFLTLASKSHHFEIVIILIFEK